MAIASQLPLAPPWGRRAVMAFLVVALACRRAPESGTDAGTAPAAPRAETREFTMADLVTATRLDTHVQRVLAFASEYKTALTFDRGPRLTEHTDIVAKRLDEAVRAMDESLRNLRDPRDRARAAAVVAGARRWPALLQAARAELLASPQPARRAADQLAVADEEVARELVRYRGFRASWRITDSPSEPETVLAFLRARRALEEEEVALGNGAQASADGADAGAGDPTNLRTAVEEVVSTARRAAGSLDERRKASAGRYVDAEERALLALVAMNAGGAPEEERGRRALEYQIAKVDALEAMADYVRLTAADAAR